MAKIPPVFFHYIMPRRPRQHPSCPSPKKEEAHSRACDRGCGLFPKRDACPFGDSGGWRIQAGTSVGKKAGRCEENPGQLVSSNRVYISIC